MDPWRKLAPDQVSSSGFRPPKEACERGSPSEPCSGRAAERLVQATLDLRLDSGGGFSPFSVRPPCAMDSDYFGPSGQRWGPALDQHSDVSPDFTSSLPPPPPPPPPRGTQYKRPVSVSSNPNPSRHSYLMQIIDSFTI
jgi:hypothetical protein